MSPEIKQLINLKTVITALVLAVITGIGGCALTKLNEVKS